MFRIATYNLENFDEDTGPDPAPSFAERAAVIRPALERLRADILCFQEINGQERDGEPRGLHALRALLSETRYAEHTFLSTTLKNRPDVYNERNLVTAIPPGWTAETVEQINGDVVPNPLYRRQIAEDEDAREINWERPLLYTKLRGPSGKTLHVINVHFKSKIATRADDLMEDRFTWRSSAGWAEGYFVSSMKRVGAALEARVVIDQIFDDEPDAAIVIAGDFNADTDEVPVVAIRGRVEETGNGALAPRVMVPLENNVPESARFSLYHRGKGEMIDHLLASRSMVRSFSHTEIHNEILPDESIAFATDPKFPEPDHAPIVAAFHEDLLIEQIG